MHRLLCVSLYIAAGFVLAPAGLFSQTPTVPEKLPEPKPGEAAKSKVGLEQIKVPPGGVVVVVDNLKEAMALQPKMILMAVEEYQKLVERVAQLEKQIKAEKKSAQVCKLSGKIDGDFVFLRAEYVFMTEQPRTTVALGLAGAHLTDEGELDRQVPNLDFGEDGFVIKVEKEGTHKLTLNLKAPVVLKRGGKGDERGFDLSLPGAAVTTLALDLPAGIKEIRWNDTTEKPSAPNRWDLALGKIKTVSVSWKEPVSLPGGAPLPTAEAQIQVKVEQTHVLVDAEIAMEDLRGQTKEWQLLLPRNAKIEVKAPAALDFKLLNPDAKRPFYVVRLKEPSAESIRVKVQLRIPRPFPEPHLPIGPFAVLGAYRQEGTISVTAASDVLRGHRLVFHRTGDVYPREVPPGSDVVAIYRFWNGAADVATAKAPLELEIKTEKYPAEAGLEHLLNLRQGRQGWVIDITTTIQLKNRADFLDIQLPRLPAPRLDALGIAAGISFPAALPWSALASAWTKGTNQATPLSFYCDDDQLKLSGPDDRRIARLTWNRSQGNEAKLTGKYLVPAGANRVTFELPRPLGVLDRGAKVRIKWSEPVELLSSGAGFEGIDPEKQEALTSWDTFPQSLNIAWKLRHTDFAATGLADVWLHERHAEVKLQLDYVIPKRPQSPGNTEATPLRFKVPTALRELAVVSGGKLVLYEPAKETAWIIPSGEPSSRALLQLRYDLPLPKRPDPELKNSKRMFDLPFISPEKTTLEHAKVRIWSEAGATPFLAESSIRDGAWKDSGVEVVAGSDVLPALVLQSNGTDLPLALELKDSTQGRLESLICDRGLIQVTIDHDGWQSYRARYLVQKLNARHLDIEFPMPAVNCQLNIWLDNQKITNWEPLDGNPHSARIPVYPRLYQQPVVLEIEYKLPANFTDSQRPWRAFVVAPRLPGDFSLGRIRWQVIMPTTWLGVVPDRNLEYRWGLLGWLMGPEPAVTSSELESWLTGREAKETLAPVSMVFGQTGQESVTLLHLSRQWWLLLCSGAILALGFAVNVMSLPLSKKWLVLAGCGVALLAIGLFWPEWLPALVYGCQPGVAVLLVLLGIQWMLHENYRRRLVFMPGIPREKASSSVTPGGTGRNRREPTTVDAPGPSGHSVPPATSFRDE